MTEEWKPIRSDEQTLEEEPTGFLGSDGFNMESAVNALRRLTINGTGQRFLGKDFKALCGPLVYVFLHDKEALYVGMSRLGLARPTGRHHKSQVRDLCNEVMVWPTRSEKDALELEAVLIFGLRPRFNGRRKVAARQALAGKALGVGPQQVVELGKRRFVNGPQDEKERLWKADKKEFIRRYIRGESAAGGTEQSNSNRDVADSIV